MMLPEDGVAAADTGRAATAEYICDMLEQLGLLACEHDLTDMGQVLAALADLYRNVLDRPQPPH